METAAHSVMKTLAATLSRQRGIQYEFGPEYAEYTASKAAGDEGKSHLKLETNGTRMSQQLPVCFYGIT